MVIIEGIRNNDFIIVDLYIKEAPIKLQFYDCNVLCKDLIVNKMGKVSIIIKHSSEGFHDLVIRKNGTYVGRRRFIIRKKKEYNQKGYRNEMRRELERLIKGEL